MSTPPFADRQISKKIPYSFAKTQGVLLTHCTADGAEVQVRAGAAAEALAEVRRVLGVPLRATLLPLEAFDKALAHAYAQADGSAAALVGDVEQDMDLSQLIHDLPQTEDLLDAENDAPVIRMINVLLTQAVREHASDIHVEPFETRSVVRFRVDGTLKDVVEPHRVLHAAMVSRIKIMAELDIAEKRLPQDGRITLGWPGVRWMCGYLLCPRVMASAWYCVCSTRMPGGWIWSAWAWIAQPWSRWMRWCISRMASCW